MHSSTDVTYLSSVSFFIDTSTANNYYSGNLYFLSCTSRASRYTI
jgi:hypothetical protein